jgi:hypothetical protein
MFRSPFDAFAKEDLSNKNRSKDGQGEPLEKKSRVSEDGHDVAESATINKHHDGSYSVETEEGLTKHDDYESAADHAGKHVGHGDEFGEGHESHAASKPSVRTKHTPSDDMSGADM